MTSQDSAGADAVARLLTLPLVAMRAVIVIPPEPIEHMPACTVRILETPLLVAATAEPAPAFADTLEQVSRTGGDDVLLIRGGRHPEILDPVSVDVALHYGDEALVLRDMQFFRHADRGLWLLPTTRGPFVELTCTGLRLEMLPPFLDAEDRTTGLCRAAAEIVRLMRRRPRDDE